MSRKITHESAIEKVELNDWGDYILVDPSDATFWGRFTGMLKAIEDKGKELDKLGAELSQKYEGKPMLTEDGADLDQIKLFVSIQIQNQKFMAEEISKVFGQDIFQKYFRAHYEVNKDFVPDEECLYDFVDKVGAVLAEIYGQRRIALNKKYNANRKPS